MADWSATQPRVTEPPVYCERLRAYLSPGTFVIIDCSGENNEEIIGQETLTRRQIGCIVGAGDVVNLETCVVVNLFHVLEVNEFKALNIRPVQDLRIRDIPEITQTISCTQVPSKAVASIAFVFPLNELKENEAICCHGMDTLFVLRFRSTVEPVNPGWCLPFPSRYLAYRQRLPDCYASRIWNSLKVIRSEISRLLGRYSEKQGIFNTVRSKVTINNDTWEYLLFKVSAVTGMPRETITTSVKRLLLPGLTLKSVRVSSNGLMIRFETLDDLQALSRVFGQQVTIEVRKRQPPINKPSDLCINDAINVIVGSKEKHVPLNARIDLTFDGRTELKICIRYRRYQYQISPTSGNPRNCPLLLKRIIKRKRIVIGKDNNSCSSNSNSIAMLVEVITDGDDQIVVDSTPSVTISSEFEYDGKIFRVCELDKQQEQVRAICIYPIGITTTEMTLSIQEAQVLIANRLE